LPDKLRLAVAAKTIPWYKLKLADAGYFPGPIDDKEDADFFPAWREFQRSCAVPDNTKFKRLAATSSFNADTKNALDTATVRVHSVYGNATDYTDLATNDASTQLAKNDITQKLNIYVNDCHFYTQGKVAGAVDPNIAMGNYRETMHQPADGKNGLDAKSIARPWIPVEASPRLLSRESTLQQSALPAETPHMKEAIGPIRIDWGFTEADEDVKIFDDIRDKTKAKDEWQEIRPHVFTAKVFLMTGGKYNTRNARNCPVANGGLRPADTAKYHQAIFGFGAKSLKPWYATPDDPHGRIHTIVHDDVGQAAEQLHPDCLGKAGVYFHPSNIAGDGYRLRAQVSFSPDGGSALPNWEVLKQRYPQSQVKENESARLPLAQSCRLRIWRRTVVRAYVEWAPNTEHDWKAHMEQVILHFRAAFVHVCFEGGAALEYTAENLLRGEEETFRDVVSACCTGPAQYKVRNNITLNPRFIWPWITQKGFGVQGVPDDTVSLDTYNTLFLAPVWKDTWLAYYDALMALLIDRIEKETGKMRGHVIVVFESTPRYFRQLYRCDGAARHSNILIEKTSAGGSHDGDQCIACNSPIRPTVVNRYTCPHCNDQTETHDIQGNNAPVHCLAPCGTQLTRGAVQVYGQGSKRNQEVTLTCQNCHYTEKQFESYNSNATYNCPNACNRVLVRNSSTVENLEETKRFWVPAVGPALGGVWLWNYKRDDGMDAVTWVHELGHCRHLVHAAGVDMYEYNTVDYKEQHDSAENAHVTAQDAKPRQKQWDRRCTMSYTTGVRFFCGKCVLKNRGWKVESIPLVDGSLDHMNRLK
jgi:hypothetical protein